MHLQQRTVQSSRSSRSLKTSSAHLVLEGLCEGPFWGSLAREGELGKDADSKLAANIIGTDACIPYQKAGNVGVLVQIATLASESHTSQAAPFWRDSQRPQFSWTAMGVEWAKPSKCNATATGSFAKTHECSHLTWTGTTF